MFYEPKDGHGLAFNPFKAIVSPRPIAWVSTLSEEGVPNLAPFSFFNGVSDVPPIVMFSCAPPSPSLNKDTRANCLNTKEFVIHVVAHEMRDAMNVSSGGFPPDVDEFEAAGLTKAPSSLIKPPRIADAPVAMECKLHDSLALPGPDGLPGYTVIYGEVIGIHIADAALKEGKLDVTTYNPLARLGYHDYSTVFETFSLVRPS